MAGTAKQSSSHLCNKKVGIIDNRVPLLHSLEGGWARAVASTLRGLLLGSGIHRLPPSKPSWQVCPRHPNLIPDMEVPVANARHEYHPALLFHHQHYSRYIV